MTSTAILAIPLLLVGVAARAEDADLAMRHAHAHGAVTLNVALDGNRLTIEVLSPAINVTGFEHAPRTAPERAAAAQARKLFDPGLGLFLLPGVARCRTISRDVEAPAWDSQGSHPDESDASERAEQAERAERAEPADPVEHAKHEEHEEREEREEHAGYEARYEIHCARPEHLAWLEVPLFDRLRGDVTMTVNVVTPGLQGRQLLESARTRVALR